MPIRRRITTTIDEIDDSVDRHSNTSFPKQPVKNMLLDADTGTSIESPETTDEEIFDRDSLFYDRNIKPTVGRTFPDLLIEIKNDYRAMAVVFTVVSILIFVIFNDIEPIIYPLLTAILLNIIWFGVPPLVSVLKGFRKKRQ